MSKLFGWTAKNDWASKQRADGPACKKLAQIRVSRALLVGFGTLLAFMAFTGIDSLRSLRAFEANNGQIRQDFLYRENTLGQVRAGLYESTSLLSDYFLAESDSHAQEAFRVQLRSIETDRRPEFCNRAFTRCLLERRSRSCISATKMEGYWLTIGSALSPDVEGRERDAALRRAVIQRNVKGSIDHKRSQCAECRRPEGSGATYR